LADDLKAKEAFGCFFHSLADIREKQPQKRGDDQMAKGKHNDKRGKGKGGQVKTGTPAPAAQNKTAPPLTMSPALVELARMPPSLEEMKAALIPAWHQRWLEGVSINVVSSWIGGAMVFVAGSVFSLWLLQATPEKETRATLLDTVPCDSLPPVRSASITRRAGVLAIPPFPFPVQTKQRRRTVAQPASFAPPPRPLYAVTADDRTGRPAPSMGVQRIPFDRRRPARAVEPRHARPPVDRKRVRWATRH
jgi:hypothetical protein